MSQNPLNEEKIVEDKVVKNRVEEEVQKKLHTPMRYINRLSNRLVACRNLALEPLDLTSSQADVLIFILFAHKRHTLTVSKIMEYLPLTHQTISGIVSRLESKGLIRKVACKTDARSVTLLPTEESMCLERLLREHAITTEKRMLAGFTPEEKENFTNYLSRALKNLQAEQGTCE